MRTSFFTHLKRYLLAGVLVTAPAFVTLYTTIGLVRIVDRWVKSLLPARFYPDFRLLGVPGIGLVLLLGLLIIIGFFTTSWLGRVLVSLTDRFFNNTPVFRSLYSTFKQLFHTLLGDNTTAFRQVVYVEFPRDGVWSIGFITGPAHPGTEEIAGEMLFVFVPTTPNPTSGFLIMVPKDRIRASSLTVEQGLKTVVSLGITR
ncbi:MAG: DUF502 domain-containing protein [Planctomycetes bacterium]|nr:DUF502 domain-containing protein [Planctomycetota bacterium]